jgi:hypothetical protein
MLPITLARDLLVIQPVEIETIDWNHAFWNLCHYESFNFALEFDPWRGYLSGSNALRFGIEEPGAYGPPPPPNGHGKTRAMNGPLEFITTASYDIDGRMWFLDCRIRLQDGAVI